jgi:hypothetical protein
MTEWPSDVLEDIRSDGVQAAVLGRDVHGEGRHRLYAGFSIPPGTPVLRANAIKLSRPCRTITDHAARMQALQEGPVQNAIDVQQHPYRDVSDDGANDRQAARATHEHS